MEVYILDSLLRREVVVDRFISCIWTERYREIGDFKLQLVSTPTNRANFDKGKRLSINDSFGVMAVETIEKVTDSEGRQVLNIEGRSLEAILEDRVAMDPTNFATGDENWHLSGLPKAVVEQMFHDICIVGMLNTNDIIPLLGGGPLFPDDTIDPPDVSIDWNQPPDSLYNAVKGPCDIYDMGFRLVRNPITNQLRFDVYTGSDRTLRQLTLPSVVFSPELENMTSTSELTTNSQTKNCAYVTTEVEGAFYYQLVYDEHVDPTVAGFERKVLLVKVSLDDSEITTIPDSINAALQQHGLEELTKHRAYTVFDGEITQTSQYKYNRDYFLGDLVGIQNADGFINNMRVTEHIFVSDEQGDRSYPTLAVNDVIEPGTWAAWGYEVWDDLGAETWADQP